MSTRESKLSSSDDDGHPESGQRPVLRRRSRPNFNEMEPENTGFSATCENTALSDWIQLVQMNRRDAVIGIKRHDGKKALLWCRDGDIIDAWCDGVTGEDAVYRALTWEGGQVSVAFAPFEHERQIEIATPALLLRAAYRKDSGVRELRPEARSPSSVAPAAVPVAPPAEVAAKPAPAYSVLTALPSLGARPMSSSLPPPVRTVTLPTPAASLPTRKRAWLVGLALAALPLAVLTISFWVTPKPALRKAPARPVTTHAEASRVAVVPSPTVSSPAREGGLPAPSVSAETAPVHEAAKPSRRALASRQPAPVPQKASIATASKPETRAKPNEQLVEVRAPRVQIIDERESKIEVIE